MKESIQILLMQLSTIGLFIFIGLAIHFNIKDQLTGSNDANFINLIGLFLVPIVALISFIILKKYTKNPGVVV